MVSLPGGWCHTTPDNAVNDIVDLAVTTEIAKSACSCSPDFQQKQVVENSREKPAHMTHIL